MIVEYKHSLFESNTNSYCIFIYKNVETKENITCVGNSLPHAKIRYEFEVKEVNHPKYGLQYQVVAYKEHIGTGRNNVVAYLSSGLIRGVGKVMAERIYDRFGDNALKVLEEEPERYLKIKGISKAKLEKIVKSYEENHIPGEIMDFFAPFNISIADISNFYKIYKRGLIDEVKINPFILCKFKGVTFKDIDPIRIYLEQKPNSSDRVFAAASEIIKKFMVSGMVGVTREQLLPELCNYTGLAAGELWKIIIRLIGDNRLDYRKISLADENIQYFYLPEIKKIEEELADMIVRCANTGDDESDKALKLLDKHSELDRSQREAVLNCFSCRLSVITGGPGTGKTTTIKEIVKIQESLHPEQKIYLMAPTGLAARRMCEATGMPATTIHKGLELGVHTDDDVYEYTEDACTIKDALLIIDEFSMVDMLVAHKVFSSIVNTRVILVGDVDQLPSVSCGNVLKDIINSGLVKTAYLKYVHRQSGDSTICENAALIREGASHLTESDDFAVTKTDADLLSIQESMVKSYVRAYEAGNRSIMCLSPYKRYDCGVYALNNAIQAKINPLDGRIEVNGTNDMVFRVGDKVMHILSNEDDVVNGDIGRVARIYSEDNEQIVEVEYETTDGKIYKDYDRSKIKNLTLAYAMTIHKSQGSECDKVIMVITSFHRTMLKRKILYTGITRAKKNVELFVTSQELIDDIVANTHEVSRNTLLSYLIKQKTDTLYTQQSLNL